MSKLTKNFKGQISKETEKAIEISIVNKDEMFTAWIPKSALNMKEMKEDYLTVTGIQEFHIKQWFVDSKAKEETTKTEFLEKADQITTEAKPDIIIPTPETVKVKSASVALNIPRQPVEFPYFPGMTIFELRDYHKHEEVGAIRGHIENIIMSKEKAIEDKAYQATVIRYFIQLLEGKGK